MNNNKFCVYDFETDDSDPNICSPVQLACVIVDPRRLEIVPGSEFNVKMKPQLLEDNENHEYTSDILEWHAKNKGTTPDKILAEWKTYPKQSVSWKRFCDYLEKYHCRGSKKNQFSAPIACGYNINKFDSKIIDRLSVKYGNVNKENNTNIFHPRDSVDVMKLIYFWFENDPEIKSFQLDDMRDYFGISKDGGHDAMKDSIDTANIMIRFIKLHRKLKLKVKFKGSFGNG